MVSLWFVVILTVKNRWLPICGRNLYDYVHVSIPALWRFGHVSTGKCVTHGSEQGLEISANFHFSESEKGIKLSEK